MSCKNTSYKCSSSGNGKNFQSLKKIVENFLSWAAEKQDEHNHIKKRLFPLTCDDIGVAATCKVYNKHKKLVISSHQCRIGGKKLKEAGDLLKGVKSKINKGSNFAELHNVVKDRILPERGIGPLAVYDISVRLGKMKGLFPTMVYPHRGTLEGARSVLGKIKEGVYPEQVFPKELEELTPDQIETVLCVYKDDLKKLKDDGKIGRFIPDD